MSDRVAVDSALPLRLTIESSPAWHGWSGTRRTLVDFRAALQPIIDAWRLPVRPLLQWRADPLADWPGDSVLRLSFGDGREAFVRVPAPGDATPAAVARALAHAAHSLRDAWLSPDVLARLGIGAERHALVQEAGRRGIAPWRFVDAGDPAAARAPDEVAPGLGLDVSSADPEGEQSWHDRLIGLAEAMFDELGAWLPPLQIQADAGLPAGTVRLRLNDLPLPRIDGLARGFMVAVAAPESLASIGIAGTPIADPYGGEPCALVADTAAARQAIAAAGHIVWDSSAYTLLGVAAAVRSHAWALWSRDASDAALERQARSFEALVRAWRQRFDAALLHDLLTRLLRERVCIRNLRAILETMLAVQRVVTIETANRVVLPPTTGQVMVREGSAAEDHLATPSAAQWLEQVRVALAPSIIVRLARGGSTLAVYEVDLALVTQLRDAPESFRATDRHQKLVAAICTAFGRSDPEAPKVLLTTRATRAGLRELIAADFAEVAVVSGAELGGEVPLKVLGRIEWPYHAAPSLLPGPSGP